MGEDSKTIGEEGENLVRDFFKRIGWSPVEEGLTIPCDKKDDHKLKASKGPRQSHGLDFLFSYLCPLTPNTRRNILISMKNSDHEKTVNKTSLVKDDLKDLDTLLDCFSRSEKRKNLVGAGGAQYIEDHGVLIRINRDPSKDQSFLGKGEGGIQRSKFLNSLFFVENERFDFVDCCMNYAGTKLQDLNPGFNIQRTSLSVSGDAREFRSQILPFHSLVGGPIILRSGNGSRKELIIFSPDPFSEGTLKKLVGLAQQLSVGWADKIRFVFEDYNRTNDQVVNSVKGQIKDKEFAETIECDSFEVRSRLR